MAPPYPTPVIRRVDIGLKPDSKVIPLGLEERRCSEVLEYFDGKRAILAQSRVSWPNNVLPSMGLHMISLTPSENPTEPTDCIVGLFRDCIESLGLPNSSRPEPTAALHDASVH